MDRSERQDERDRKRKRRPAATPPANEAEPRQTFQADARNAFGETMPADATGWDETESAAGNEGSKV